jgi:hypothetical protein
MMVLLLPAEPEVSLAPEGLARLATLGITSVALLKDAEALAFVLEGWAFDPVRSGPEAKELLSAGNGAARTLHQVMDVAINRDAAQSHPISLMPDSNGRQQVRA